PGMVGAVRDGGAGPPFVGLGIVLVGARAVDRIALLVGRAVAADDIDLAVDRRDRRLLAAHGHRRLGSPDARPLLLRGARTAAEQQEAEGGQQAASETRV